MAARHCIVRGRVQGVGFRYFTCRAAEKHDIKGWVRNLPSGDVEMYATGDDDSMARFMEEVGRGTSLALVEYVEVRDVESKPFSGFSIER
jgi:acylphosphatase